MGLVLDPEVKMRPDGGRAILFTANPGDALGEPAFRFLYPQQAIILALFDGQRDLQAVKEATAYLFGLDLERASQSVEFILDLDVNKGQTIRSFVVDAEGIDSAAVRIYDPKDYVVNVEAMDFNDVRCTRPCSVLVLPTMRCFTECVYCYADRRYSHGVRELHYALFERLVREVKDCGIETIEFSGGDIFCRKDALDLIGCVLAEGLYANIPTKYPLTRQQVKELASAGLYSIQISIDALDPQVIDQMTRKRGYGELILQSLDELGEAGIRVRTNTVLTPCNLHDAINLARYLGALPHVFKSVFNCYSPSLYSHRDSLFCGTEEIERFEEAFRVVRDEYPRKGMFFSGALPDPFVGDEEERAASFRKRAFCTANRRGVVVLPDGRVTVCEELYFHDYFIIGDLNKQPLLEIWNSPRALELAHPDQATVSDGACKDCPDFYLCNEGLGRCVRDTLKAYGADKPHWPDPRCHLAPAGNRMA